MLARTRLKLRNAEKSINFMQEQHSKILEGLHQEIDKLQKKNARLTFQLTMNGEGNLTGKDLQLQDVLITTGSELAKVKLSLSKEQQKAALLQNQVDDLLSKHCEELTAKDDSIKKLSIELDSKADLVVLLTQQIYRLRAKLKQESESTFPQSTACSCPYCYVHSKISPEGRVLLSTPTQGTSQVRKIMPLRKTDGRHHTHSVPTSLANADDSQHTPSKVTRRSLVPTPPPSTPPLSASGRRRILMKRTSTPEVRVPLSADMPNDLVPTRDLQTPQDSYSYEIKKRTPQAPCNQEGNIRTRNSRSDETHLISSRESEDEKNFLARTAYKDTPTILPPIVEPSTLDFSEESQKNSHPSHILEVERLSEVSHLQQHKASYLAKFPGLSSAPPSSLRVYHRATRSRGQGSIVNKEDQENPGPDGMLMVNENNEKTADSRARWAKGTAALDSVK